MDLIHDGDDGDEDSSATLMVSPAEEVAGETSGQVAEADQAEAAEAPLGNSPVNPSVEEEVHMEEDLGSADDDLKVVGNLKKRKRDSGKALCVMEKNFDAGDFIESQLLPGTEDYIRDADLAGQARWIYRSLLRVAAIAKKMEPVLGNFHVMEGKLRNSQKNLIDSRSREESLKKKLSEQEEKAKEDANEINRLVERDLALMKDLNASSGETAATEKKVKDLEKKLKLAESSATASLQEAAALKKKNKEIAKGAREVVKLTEEGIKLQVAVLGPDLDLSQVGTLKTVKDGKIIDILKP
ncbi:uncharacterized protein LOC110273513 [Arachis duranensis]|uniref:Uncharacterized protein LOC110273513 n=1 Tax=Arachis duranensis TaxID=130453 RepID=A0A9C6T6J4_ARADU|nr:uncharacterized protein LOC110273513 [Arachis duranensis]